MDRNKLFLIGGLLMVGIVLAGGYFVGVSPQLSASAASNAEQHTIQTTNDQYGRTLVSLKAADANKATIQSELATLEQSVPVADSALPAFLTQVQQAADAAGLTVSGVTVKDAEPYVPPVTPAKAGAAATTTTAGPPAPTTYGNGAITGANFAAMPVTVTVTGSYTKGLAFTKSMQSSSGRLFLVNTVGMTPNKGTGPIGSQTGSDAVTANTPFDTTIGGFIYVLGNNTASGTSTAGATATTSGQ